MDGTSRLTKPSSTTIKESITQESSTTQAPDQKKIQTGIAQTTDAFESKKEGSLFTANPNTGEVKFGSGVTGKTPPIGTQITAQSSKQMEGLLKESKAEITNYFKGEAGTASSEIAESFRGTKQYLMSAQSKINLDNKKIDQQMKEAGEKANIAMDAANTQLVTGVVSAAISIGGAVANLKGVASEAKNNLTQNSLSEARYQQFNSALSDLEKQLAPRSDRKSDELQKRIYGEEQAANRKQATESDSTASANHRDRIRDAILDFVRKLGEMDPKI